MERQGLIPPAPRATTHWATSVDLRHNLSSCLPPWKNRERSRLSQYEDLMTKLKTKIHDAVENEKLECCGG
jgi:hypothetical protein